LLYGCAGHFATFRRTLSARFGAALTVFILVLRAFGGASLADVGTNAAEGVHEPRIPAHEARAAPADVRAIHAEPGALR